MKTSKTNKPTHEIRCTPPGKGPFGEGSPSEGGSLHRAKSMSPDMQQSEMPSVKMRSFMPPSLRRKRERRPSTRRSETLRQARRCILTITKHTPPLPAYPQDKAIRVMRKNLMSPIFLLSQMPQMNTKHKK
jgi:hypothetical protein